MDLKFSFPRIFRLVLLPVILSLWACSRYSFEINNNEIYTPPSIFTNFEVQDPALETCLKQTIRDQKITTASELEILLCSYSGIDSLRGINTFSRLRQVSFKGNNISNISELLQLTHLEYLDLTENPLTDCQTIKQLETVIAESFVHDATCN